MKKLFIYFLSLCFFYSVNLGIITQYDGGLLFAPSYALTISGDKKQEIVEMCMAEDSSKTQDECEGEYNNKKDELDVELQALENIGTSMGTTTSEDWSLFVGVILNIAMVLLGFIANFKIYSVKPSMWFSIGANVLLLVWYFGILLGFSDYMDQIKIAVDAEVDKLEDMTIEEGTNTTLVSGIETQITALESASESVASFKKSLNAAEILTWIAAGFAVLECFLCLVGGFPFWCLNKKKPNPLENFLNFFLPSFSHANFQDETLASAKEEVNDKVPEESGINMTNWGANILKVAMIVTEGLAYTTIESWTKKTAAKSAGKWIACAARMGFFSWDAYNLMLLQEKWDQVKEEIDKRVTFLKNAKDFINNSLADRNNGTLDTSDNLSNTTDDQPVDPLGENIPDPNLTNTCFEVDQSTLNNQQETGDDCDDNESFLPTGPMREFKRRATNIAPTLSEFFDEVENAHEGVDQGTHTQNSVENNSPSTSAKIKSFLPKLLALKKQVEKDKGKPSDKGFIDNFFEAGKIRAQQQKDFLNAIKEAGGKLRSPIASLRKNVKKDEKSAVSKVKVNDDKGIGLPKTYKLGDYKLKKGKKTSAKDLRNKEIKKYKVKHDDINKKSGVSIWKLIKNRYLKSGYPRLFNK